MLMNASSGSSTCLTTVCFAAAVWAASIAAADPIPDLYNTGVDAFGAVLPAGAIDPHWVLSSVPAGVPAPAGYVQGTIPPTWVAHTTDSRWIAPQGQFGPAGQYRYDLMFDLSAFDESTASLTGRWAADNSAQLLLNGVPAAIHSGGTGAFSFFDFINLNSGFVAGLNTLSVVVTNLNNPTSGGQTPTGLHIDDLIGSAEPRLCNLTNPGFEVFESTSHGLPAQLGDWRGDDSFVTGATLGVAPHQGAQMLQFSGTEPVGGSLQETASSVWQLVDVTQYASDIAAGRLFADLEYYANRVRPEIEEPTLPPTDDTLFSAGILPLAGTPASFPQSVINLLAMSTGQLISDDDPATWERVSTSLQVPPGTTHLAIRLAAHEDVNNSASLEFSGHFADSACVAFRVIPEPASLTLAAIAAYYFCAVGARQKLNGK